MDENLIDFEDLDANVENFFDELGITDEETIRETTALFMSALGYSEPALVVDLFKQIDEEVEKENLSGESEFLDRLRELAEE